MERIDLTSKQSKMLSYVVKHSKLPKTTKVIKLPWIASIWHQNNQKCWGTSKNIQNKAKLRKWSNYNELHRFDFKNIKTPQNYESDQTIMHCIDLTSERSKMLRYVAKLQKWSYYDEFASIWRQNDHNNAKLQTRSNYDEFASIWHQNYQKRWVTSQNIQNNAKLQNWSNYNDLHRFDVQTIKKPKTTKAIK